MQNGDDSARISKEPKFDKIPLAFCATSLVFFIFYWMILTYAIVDLSEDPLIRSVVARLPLMVILISLIGGIGLVTLYKNVGKRWYWGIPLCISLVALIFFIPLPLLLLAPCATLQLFSFRTISGKKIMRFVWISLTVSALSVIALFQQLHLFITPNEPVVVGHEPAYYLLYVLIGLPVLGVVYLILGICHRKLFFSD